LRIDARKSGINVNERPDFDINLPVNPSHTLA